MKKCTKCEKLLESIEFYSKFSVCKSCCKENYLNKRTEKVEYQRIYNSDKIKKREQDKKWRENNKDKHDLKNKKWRENNPEYKKKWEENNPDYNKNYYVNNIERIKNYQSNNKQSILEKRKKYYQDNKEIIKNKVNKYKRNKRKTDPLFKLTENIRNLIKNGLKNNNIQKNSKTEQILGCSYIDFKKYLESKFEPWMSWENYGKYNGELNYGWDIDHITPLSGCKDNDEIINLNNHNNLQPLCSKVNRDIKRKMKSE
jgi:hypothetical protein